MDVFCYLAANYTKFFNQSVWRNFIVILFLSVSIVQRRSGVVWCSFGQSSYSKLLFCKCDLMFFIVLLKRRLKRKKRRDIVNINNLPLVTLWWCIFFKSECSTEFFSHWLAGRINWLRFTSFSSILKYRNIRLFFVNSLRVF